ncbi:hypothetical protein DIZ81_05420 [Legionella taurinensis]|uniref:Uncharacterized protein n=1 Tax=Legionella taurinensis TaxID=70611 RepID=A0A3A5L8L2_9GAMM|nr:hypothetical protein [Legionella taurinensis]MDX1837352.1 hypothetical protein [Legionella taurinensis]PUT40706.1 hypothetical protein DB744_05420 [Legionella taurinensis]PUT44128.1 hypothetical protein DB746_03820 [Legionella taurinensis]PUT47429.1 hypothetical protein DB743_01990 [Legionella taurinensis]PUT48568.1 hypothetical protein DB745_03820 [Legionella taurinensis]
MKTKTTDELTHEQTKKARTAQETPLLPSFTEVLIDLNKSPVFQHYALERQETEKRIKKKLVQLVRELDDDLERTLTELTQLRAEDEKKQAQLNEAQERIRGLELENEALTAQNNVLREEKKTLLRCNERLYQQKLSFFNQSSSSEATTHPDLADFNQSCTVLLSD